VKILQVHNSYLNEGGEDQVVRAEADALRGAGDEVVEVGMANPGRFGAQSANLALAPWNPRSARWMASIVERHGPDLAHVHNTWYRLTPSVITALKRRAVPVVMTVHNYRMMCANAVFFRDGSPCTECLGRQPWRSVAYRCYRGSAAQSLMAAGTIAINRSLNTWEDGVDRFVVSTEFVADRLVDAGFPRDRMRIVPAIVPDAGLRTQPPSASSSVVYVGRLDEGKGLEAVVEAWRRIPASLELVIVGDGPLRATLEALAVPRVRFVGWKTRPEVDKIMRTSRAMVFPSAFFETLGMSLAEALAAGLPVIAGSVGTRPEILGNNGAGWLIDLAQPDAWQGALTALTEAEAVDRAGVAARERYNSEFAPAVALPRLRAVFQEVASI
jgi:glycosyltransferase involved in cell wall biosynthesis